MGWPYKQNLNVIARLGLIEGLLSLALDDSTENASGLAGPGHYNIIK